MKSLASKRHLQSNRTLAYVMVQDNFDQIQTHVNMATEINQEDRTPGAAGRAKVIQFQLQNRVRAELAALQGINHSVYGVRLTASTSRSPVIDRSSSSWTRRAVVALKSSIVGLFSRVYTKECIQNQAASNAAKIDEYRTIDRRVQCDGRRAKAKLQEYTYNTRLATMDESDRENITLTLRCMITKGASGMIARLGWRICSNFDTTSTTSVSN